MTDRSSSRIYTFTSYFNVMAFDLKLIPTFDSSKSGQSTVEGFKKAELMSVEWVVKRRICRVPAIEQREVCSYRLYKENAIHSLCSVLPSAT